MVRVTACGTPGDGGLPRDLGNGLVLRWSEPADAEDLAAFTSTVFRDGPEAPADETMRDFVRRQLRGDFPSMGPGDYALVEDTAKSGNRVVACACHLREEWSLGGVPIPVGRPEIVASDPEYRNRGLIRAIFGALHARSEVEGRPLQGITGIPYFYRQFGYGYALDLGGAATVQVDLLPPLAEGQTEACRLRPATFDDVPVLAAAYDAEQRDGLVSVRVPETVWRYHIGAELGQPAGGSGFARLRVIESSAGELCGYVVAPDTRESPTLRFSLGLLPGRNLQRLAPSLVRALRDFGEGLPVKKPDTPLRRLALGLGRDHPLYHLLHPDWGLRIEPPYAWYIRIPDVPAFLRLIAPVLRRRLAGSALAGYDGELKLSRYRDGLLLRFASGELVDVRRITILPYDNSAKMGIPPLVLPELLLGYRSADELRERYPDVWVAAEVRALVDVLFPKARSRVIDL